MPLDILVLEKVIGDIEVQVPLHKMQVLKTLQQGFYIFGS